MTVYTFIPYLLTATFSVFLVWYFSRCDSKENDPKSLNFLRKNKMILIEGALIITGMGLRLWMYLIKPPLRGDCIIRLLTIRELSYVEILNIGRHLPSQVHDPTGILIIQKFILSLWGDHEYAARLLLVFCSVAALLLFRKAKNLFVDDYGGVVALVLFALSWALIKYSVVLNAYASDVLVVLLLYFLFMKMCRSVFTIKEIILFAFAGALSVWFSLPAIFILCGGFMALAIDFFITKQSGKLSRLVVVFTVWALSFGVYYFRTLKYFTNKRGMRMSWVEFFLPDSDLLSQMGWFVQRFYQIFVYPVGAPGWLGTIFFVLGARSFWKTDKLKFLILILPIFLVFLASCFLKYPFGDRSAIFLLPSIYLIIGRGWFLLYDRGRRRSRSVIAGVALILLIMGPIQNYADRMISRTKTHPLVKILETIKNNYRDGDIIYVHWRMRKPFEYYNMRFGFSKDQYMLGQKCKKRRCPDVVSLRKYNKVWFISRLNPEFELNAFLAGFELTTNIIKNKATTPLIRLDEIAFPNGE